MEEEFKDKEIYLKDHDQTEYVFRIILEVEMIKFWLRENKIYAPFTFEASFTLQDMIDHHKVFRACDDLEEIHKHLLNLCDKGKVKLYACGPDSERNIIFQVNFIANENEDTNDFVVTLKMTEEKDRDLLELYKIQKAQIAKLRQIKNLINQGLSKEHPLYKEINSIIEQCRSKVDY